MFISFPIPFKKGIDEVIPRLTGNFHKPGGMRSLPTLCGSRKGKSAAGMAADRFKPSRSVIGHTRYCLYHVCRGFMWY